MASLILRITSKVVTAAKWPGLGPQATQRISVCASQGYSHLYTFAFAGFLPRTPSPKCVHAHSLILSDLRQRPHQRKTSYSQCV